MNAWWSFSLHVLQAGMWIGGLLLVLWAAVRLRWPKLVALLVFLTMDLVMFGAYVRLADAGLGCPDWPGCYAHFTPAQVSTQIHHAERVQPGGSEGQVNPFKAWVEMIHRYVATVIGTLIVAMVLRAWMSRPRVDMALPLVLLGWIVLQGLFGAWTVTLKLKPLIVTGHLMGGVILLVLAAWFWMINRDDVRRCGAGPGARALMVAALVAVLAQVFLGGWVSTNYAAVACTGFPTCNGSFHPNADWAHGYALWRNLGENADGSLIPTQALVAIQWGHRLFALLVTLLVLLACRRMARETGLRDLALRIAALMLAQIAIGAGVVEFSHPLLLSVVHNGVAALLILLLTIATYRIGGPPPTELTEPRPSRLPATP